MLIVDDVEINRVVLTQFFQDEYLIIEAQNGREALDVIEKQPVSVVLMDLVMPVMDGFELLGVLKRDTRYAELPVIVMTAHSDGDSEARAMEMGAADFITKPYNPIIVRCRVKNVMARLENEWRKIEQAAKDRQIIELHRYIEKDSLTGLYNRETFYQRASALIQRDPDRQYSIIYLDISCFKVINDLFHVETGNLILKTAAYYFMAVIDEAYGACGRIEADHFVVCIPTDRFNIERMLEGLDQTIQSLGVRHNILFYAGIYPVDNPFLPVDQMCDRAHMALNKIKGNYMNRYAYYDTSMRDLMMQEQMIVRDMEFALQEQQFVIYLQPVYNIEKNHIVSAEALVRWMHPTDGVISPGKFIPIFERNGFIVRLDRFVWESVCRFLHDRRQRGEEIVPVSVNVSRLNFYNRDLLEFLLGLLEKYDLEAYMLKLEVTESAYTDNPYQLCSIINSFREHGFPVLMDDFGSGFSSLNMLKNLPMDVLKIDMGFVQELESSERANIVMKGIVNLAKELNMGVIVEGVETKRQLDLLAAIGCDEIQGYYFSRPLPVQDFVDLLDKDLGSETCGK
ncbi:MAG: EAL domain-containing protein [Selenomonadaceae bacterium]|nr:EAL domain-containing protein [Selenomonadaceae bacterium]